MVVKMTAIVLLVLLSRAPGCGTAQSTVAPSPTPARPPEVAAVLPAPGSRVCRQPELRVELRLTDALRRDGAFAPERVVLSLDGRDVTREARATGTLDFPQGRAVLVYVPPAPLVPGSHRAAIAFPGAARPERFEWTFVVDDVPCR